MTWYEQMQQQFFEMYKMDYEFGWADKAYMKGLVAQGNLTADGYKQIVGEDYAPEAPQNTPVKNA